MIKFLHTSDWHLGKMIYGHSLLEDQEYLLKKVFLPLVEKERPDFVVLAGDVYDRPVAPVEAIRLFDWVVEQMAEKSIPFLVISGNHDGADRMCIGARLLRQNGVYITAKLEDSLQPVDLSVGERRIQIFLLPYFEPAEARQLLGDDSIRGFGEAYQRVVQCLEENRDPSLPSVLVSHCFAAGSRISDSETALYVGGSGEISTDCFEPFTYVALGHLHGPQKAGNSGRYSGSPLCYSFDEISQKKGFTMVEIEDSGQVHTTQIPTVPLHPMRVLSGSFEELMDQGKHKPCQDYIYVTLTDDRPVFLPVDQLRAYYPNLLGLSSQWLKGGGLENLTGEEGKKRELLKQKNGETEIIHSFLSDICGQDATKSDEIFIGQILARVREGMSR